MARTRSAKGSTPSTAATSTAATSTKSKYVLPDEVSNPPKVFILPHKATTKARIVSLLNPRYSKPTRYLVCPESGIYEFTQITAPKSTPRSWLIECSSKECAEGKQEDGSTSDFTAFVTKGAEMFIATPVDPMFLILPAVASQAPSKTGKRLFLSSEDHFEAISSASSPHFSDIVRWEGVRKLLEARMGAICDTAEAGDEIMFRYSEEKLLSEVLSKAKRMSEKPLPQSMEEKFVTKALEAPVLSMHVYRETTATSVVAELQESAALDSGASTPKTESVESQSSISSTETTSGLVSEASTIATSVAEEITTSAELKPSIQASSQVTQLQRLKIAFQFICSSYIAPALARQLKDALSKKKELIDFSPLDDYLTQLSNLRQEAAASHSMQDYSRKRVLDEEQIMERAEKRRRKEEEEKRKKAGESRGVRDLKKVNTTGMKKMSDFFKRKP